MASYILFAGASSVHSPKLTKGRIRITATVPVYWVIGENPIAKSNTCALLSAGSSIELRLPVKCSSLAVLAVNEPGTVSILELGITRPSCSA